MSTDQSVDAARSHPEIWWAAAFGALAHFGLAIAVAVLAQVAAVMITCKIAKVASHEVAWFRQKRKGPVRFCIDGREIAIWVHRNGNIDRERNAAS